MRRPLTFRATVWIAVTLWSVLFWFGFFTVLAGGV
jgi:hypothetical protein